MMKLLLLVLVAAVAAADDHGTKNSVLDVDSFSSNMEEHFEELTDVRHPRAISKEKWKQSRAYIKKAMEMIGLEVELQCFNTSVQVEYDNDQQVEGCNIIGVSRGDSSKDRIVVGAHYDSSGEKKSHTPLRDNGVAVALMLETAKAFEDSVRFKGYHRNFTTIFVAFDLNTKEQFPESQGRPGAYYFLHQWLMPKTNIQRLPIAGAYILDSISTYNTAEYSQTLPADFKNYFEDAYSRIHNSSNVGNFLAAIAPKNSADLVRTFAGHYRKDRRSRPYRLQEMVAGDRMFGATATLQMVNHQAAYQFWVSKPSIPAVLITDTDDNRQLPAGEECTVECNFVFANPQRMQFVSHTYKALSYTLLDKQTTYIGLNSVGTTTSNLAIIALSMVVAQVVTRW